MLKNGYIYYQTDHTLFVKHQKGKVTIFIFYLHDIVVTGDDQCKINNLKAFFGKEFKIKDL